MKRMRTPARMFDQRCNLVAAEIEAPGRIAKETIVLVHTYLPGRPLSPLCCGDKASGHQGLKL
jgi:hypothetical protein